MLIKLAKIAMHIISNTVKNKLMHKCLMDTDTYENEFYIVVVDNNLQIYRYLQFPDGIVRLSANTIQNFCCKDR